MIQPQILEVDRYGIINFSGLTNQRIKLSEQGIIMLKPIERII